MSRLRWTPAASEDLHTISIYLEQQRDLAFANRVCLIIYQAVQQLRRFPGSGKAGKVQGTREFVIPTLPVYTAVYRIIDPGTVELLRIWHGAQQR